MLLLYNGDPGVDPADQVSRLKLKILGDHALLQPRTHTFLKCFYVIIFDSQPIEKAM